MAELIRISRRTAGRFPPSCDLPNVCQGARLCRTSTSREDGLLRVHATCNQLHADPAVAIRTKRVLDTVGLSFMIRPSGTARSKFQDGFAHSRWVADISNYGLPTLIHMHMLDPNEL
jgi:hypothetical protein